MGDIIKMFATIDSNKINLPNFVTKNLKRFPHIPPTDVDLISQAKSIGLAAVQDKADDFASIAAIQLLICRKSGRYEDCSITRCFDVESLF